nr:probable inactive receptor kinase At4g23740 [Ipomoea batatas]
MEGLRKLALIWWLLVLSEGNATIIEHDKQALLEFVKQLPHSRALNWDERVPVCKNWTGVTCNGDGSRVIALRLPGVGFNGPIPNNTLGRLSALQILSLRSNGISGNFPPDFGNLKNLSCLYLQHNDLSGPLPSDFSVWKNLTSVNLSNNGFNGSIPYSISGLSRLTSLNLANNSISGEIPDLHLPRLQNLNLSNNDLTGLVPKSLQRFPKSVFLGNNVSFLDFSVSSPPIVSLPPQHNTGKLSEKALLGIVASGSVIAILGFGFVFLVCCLRRKRDVGFLGKLEKGRIMSPEKAISRGQGANNSLVFFEGCNYAFDLEDLLRASAEVLGKGTFGMVYKAILEDATTVVVKRLKEVGVGMKEFEQQMEIVGSIKHENVIELRAYYYSKEEKLIVCDFFSQGRNRGENMVPLDWETRVKISIGAARGIAGIHGANGGKMVHGNIKSSNIFLNSRRYGCVADVGLSAIMGSLPPPLARAAGYRAPEVMDTRKATQPSDVFSFGVLLLELLTGKSPVHTTSGDEIIHLVRWVHSVVREEWTAEVFDVELLRSPNIEEEMVEMLQIALSCVVRMPDQRPKIAEVVKMIEGVRLIDGDNSHQLCEAKSETPTSRTSPSLLDSDY